MNRGKIENTNNILGERIKKRREELGLTMEDLAVKIGVSKSSIYYLENGTNKPRLDTLQQISEQLHCSISYLIGEDEIKEDSLITTVEENGILYKIFLNKHKFPNGLTYEQMCGKIKLLEENLNKKSSDK
ncbi:helix-turn-helix domain-containing protein [Clostridium rectalis]|uniref:helix-turn-helix domain-containing protein n=1 Tax=Clostridium rectalis TaxID=2040295 RepID=UPI0013DDE45B|nr:helix-turn-helix transcriptional regulator [Clostridium rectalis]